MAGARLEPGDEAPDFTLPDADGKQISLHDYAGPQANDRCNPHAAMTPGCTTQACDFRDNLSDLDEAGYAVLGISPDPAGQARPVPGGGQVDLPAAVRPRPVETLQAYGAYGEKTMYGKTVTGVIRSTFVIDEDGKDRAGSVRRQGHRARRPAPQGSGSIEKQRAGVAKWQTRQV